MSISDCALASWRKASNRGSALLLGFVLVLWSAAAAAQTFTLTLQPNTIPAGTENTAYSQLITAVGGNAPYTFALTSGTLPTGLILDSNGLLHGTPTTPASGTFTITATDSTSNTGFRPYNFSIGTAGGLTINPGSLPAGTVGIAYNQTVTASGGNGSYTYSISAGSLPAGLSLNTGTGAITGTPSAGGTANFTVSAIDTNGNTGSRNLSINIIVPITVNPATLPNGTAGTPYNQTVTASGGTAPYTFAVTAGSLPTGLALNGGTGAITGTPTTPGPYSFTITATDANSNTGNRAYNVTINAAPLTVDPTSLPSGEVGTAYNQAVVASGGVAPYSYAVIAGALPTGLALNGGTGAITGTPSAGGTFNFTIQATDAQPNTGSRAYSVTIGTNSLTVNPASLPSATRSVPYSQTVSAVGGTGPYTFAVSAGALPAGLSLNGATGAITGTPTGSGPSTFTIRATDSLNNFGSRAYTVNTGANVLTINPATLTAAVAGRPYRATVIATGGTGPYTYSVSGGSLPPGLTLNAATGVISGTFTGGGTFSFTISALDVNGNTGSRNYSLTNRPDPALDPEVIGLVNAQVATARRFASAQIDNVSRHLESLHDRFNSCSVDIGVGLPRPDENSGRFYPDISPYSPSPGNAVRSYDGSPAGQVARRTPGLQDCENGWATDFSAWVSGSAQFGTVMPDGTVATGKFTTAGLTAGVDWRVNEDLIVGLALGFGNDHSTIGGFGTRSNATTVSGTLYASYKAFDPWFIDASLGYGGLNYNNRRFVSDDATTVAGDRQGGYWFGAISTGYEMKYDAWRVSPYVKLDFMAAQLDAYAEQGPSAELLSYATTKFNSIGGTVGLRGSYVVPMAWGVLTPTARAEYRQAFDGSYQQAMYYTDLGAGTASTLAQAQATHGTINTSLGFRARTLGGLGGEFEYGTSSGSGRVQSQTLRGTLRMAF
jgi:uncharacterized protein YhjY with autotransporter beta-barrel domain